jgi:hypothetical protein
MIEGCKLDTHGVHGAGERDGGVHQRPNIVTTDSVSTDVTVGEYMAHGVDFPDTVGLCSASHFGDSMIPLA